MVAAPDDDRVAARRRAAGVRADIGARTVHLHAFLSAAARLPPRAPRPFAGTGCIRGGGWRLPDWGGARRARGRGGALLRPHELGAVVPRPPRPRYHAPRRNATTGKVRSMIFKSSTTHRRAMYS